MAKLKEIEAEYGVRVLFASESGSRAWGFASKDSDYDVRFIYVRRMEDYLSLKPYADTIEKMFPAENIDLAGWDLRKTLSLFAKSNPSLFEWMYSPIEYRRDAIFMSGLLALKDEFFSRSACFHHYYSMAIKQDMRYLSRDGVTLKRFLYYFRALLCCKWLMTRDCPPPVDFDQLSYAVILNEETAWETQYTSEPNSLKNRMDIYNMVNHLVEKKGQGREYDYAFVEQVLINYAEALRSEAESFASSMQDSKSVSVVKLDSLFMETVKRQEGVIGNVAAPVKEKKMNAASGEPFIFSYEPLGEGSADVRIGRGEEVIEMTAYAFTTNPLFDLVYGLAEIEFFDRDKYVMSWDVSLAWMRMEMAQGEDKSRIKVRFDFEFQEGVNKTYEWELPNADFREVILKEAGKVLRKQGILGFTKDWVHEWGGTEKTNQFPLTDFLALKGIPVQMENGEVKSSSLEKELELLKSL